jgi:hypothetical protein
MRMLPGVLTAITVGCAGASSGELHGTYAASYAFGRDEIVLRQDGTYTQTVIVNGGTPVVRHGQWSLDRATEWFTPDEVVLRDCLELDNGFGELRPDYRVPVSLCLYGVRRGWTGSALPSLGPEDGIRHSKVAAPSKYAP